MIPGTQVKLLERTSWSSSDKWFVLENIFIDSAPAIMGLASTIVATCPGVREWVRFRISFIEDHTATRERAAPLVNPRQSLLALNLLESNRPGAHLFLKAVNEAKSSCCMGWFHQCKSDVRIELSNARSRRESCI